MPKLPFFHRKSGYFIYITNNYDNHANKEYIHDGENNDSILTSIEILGIINNADVKRVKHFSE